AAGARGLGDRARSQFPHRPPGRRSGRLRRRPAPQLHLLDPAGAVSERAGARHQGPSRDHHPLQRAAGRGDHHSRRQRQVAGPQLRPARDHRAVRPVCRGGRGFRPRGAGRQDTAVRDRRCDPEHAHPRRAVPLRRRRRLGEALGPAMRYRDPTASLPEIPVIDCDEGGATRLFDQTTAGAHRLADVAKRSYTAPVVAFLDWRSRQWVERNDSPYVPEIEHIAGQLSGAGAYALNCSYEWACTTAAVGPQVMRVLDWRRGGMGPGIVVGPPRPPAGSWLNVTWPGFVGVLTALAPGRFAAALNQAPLRRRTYLLPFDWLIDRVKVDHTRAMLPTHLL